MARYAVAGVGYAKVFDALGNQLFKSETLTDSGFNTTATVEKITGGAGNATQGVFTHSASFEATLKDCVSDLIYVALQTGGTITAGANIYTTEEVTTTVANQITVLGVPQDFGTVGKIGWYTIQGEDASNPTKITFVGSVASVTSLPIGTKVCVTYLTEDNSARVIEILSNFIPAEVHLVMTLPLFKAGIDATNASTSSQIGEWIVDVPRFMFDGAISLATTSASAVGFDMKGMALASTNVSGCGNKSIYATITEVIYGKDEFANVVDIAIANADVELAVAETSTLKVYAIYNDGTASRLIDNSKITFVSDTTATCTVGSHTGLVTAIGVGTSNISAVLTTKTSLSTVAVATVTA